MGSRWRSLPGVDGGDPPGVLGLGRNYDEAQYNAVDSMASTASSLASGNGGGKRMEGSKLR